MTTPARRAGTGLADLTLAISSFPAVPREPHPASPDRSDWDAGARLSLEEAVTYALQGLDGETPGRTTERDG